MSERAETLREEIATLVLPVTGHIAVSVRLSGSLSGRVDFDSDTRFPAASVIKLAVLLSVLDHVDQDRLALDETVTLDRSQDVGGFGVLADLPDLDSLRLCELLTLMITLSDNTATNACIDLVGLEALTGLLTTTGLQNTKLERRLMDFDADVAGYRNEVSASDAARLVELLVMGDVLRPKLREYAEDLLRRQRIRDRLPRRLDPRIDIGNKTGEVPGVRHDVGVLRFEDRSAVVAVLTQGFRDARTLDCTDGGQANELITDIGRVVGEHLTGNGART